MVSVTADSHIWVSAFNFPGKPPLIEMADAGEISLVVSELMIEEVLRVLREKFQWSGEALQEARYQMNGIARKILAGQGTTAAGLFSAGWRQAS